MFQVLVPEDEAFGILIKKISIKGCLLQSKDFISSFVRTGTVLNSKLLEAGRCGGQLMRMPHCFECAFTKIILLRNA